MHEFYNENVVPKLREQFGYTNPMQVPRIEKITLNMGLGEAVADKKVIEHAVSDLRKITGQQPVVTERMYEFLDRLITVAIPRIRDFRGLSAKSFDGRGNYNMGVREQIIFPEVDYDQIDSLRGMDIAITTSARTNEEGKALLEAFDFPFRK
jgi:large subunit ribosomal protein L5